MDLLLQNLLLTTLVEEVQMAREVDLRAREQHAYSPGNRRGGGNHLQAGSVKEPVEKLHLRSTSIEEEKTAQTRFTAMVT